MDLLNRFYRVVVESSRVDMSEVVREATENAFKHDAFFLIRLSTGIIILTLVSSREHQVSLHRFLA